MRDQTIESNLYAAQLTLTAMATCCVLATMRDPFFWMKLPGVRQLLSLCCVASVGWRVGPSRPYISHYGKITLGGVPYEGSDLEKKIAKRAGMVVSMLMPFEAEGNHLALMGHARPTQMSFWTTRGVSYHHLPMQDLSAEVNNQDVFELLRAMNQCINDGNRVYVHCQAGQGRSFIICMAYLLVYGFPNGKKSGHRPVQDYETALRIVKHERPQVDATAYRREKIEEIVAFCKEALIPKAALAMAV